MIQARRWYLRAAELGDARCNRNVTGRRFVARAARPIRSKAKPCCVMRLVTDKYAQAQFALGGRLYEGAGLKQNLPEAARWLELAAASGHADEGCWAS